MAKIVTLRLDEKTRERVARIAWRKRVSASDVIRNAIAAWADQEETSESPYALISDLLAVVRSGNRKRSFQTGKQFAKLLRTRRSRR